MRILAHHRDLASPEAGRFDLLRAEGESLMFRARKLRWAVWGWLGVVLIISMPFAAVLAQEGTDTGTTEEAAGAEAAGAPTEEAGAIDPGDEVETPVQKQRGSGLVTLFRQGGNFM